MKLRLEISQASFIKYSCLLLACIIAFFVRVLPIQWGAYLSEFDPFYHYRVADYIAKNGYKAFLAWNDYQSWFPSGRYVAGTTPPGLPLMVVAIYSILRSLGIHTSILDISIFFPAFIATVTCLAIYFLGKEVAGYKAGLLSAFCLALSPAYIERTYLGFLKHETIGILLIILVSLLFLRAIKPQQPVEKCFIYATIAGLLIGYLNISWGASPFLPGLITVFTILLILLRRYNSRILYAYVITFIVSIPLSIQSPRVGYGIFTSITSILSYSVIGAMIGLEISKAKFKKAKIVASLVTIFLIVGIASLFYLVGYIGPMVGKIAYVMNPILRGEAPIIESVAEHHPSSWDSFYSRFGALLVLAIVGLAFITMKRTNEGIYIALFALLALYFASSYVRLILILAPAIIILASIGVTELLSGIREVFLPKKLRSAQLAISRYKIIVGFVIFLLISLSTAFPEEKLHYIGPHITISGIRYANSPVTIASSTIPVRGYIGDWLEACAWIRDNTKEDAIIGSWWDYGYYITVVGNRTSLADNATIDTEKIKDIALAFLSREEEAIKILRKYKVDYVLVFTTMNIGRYYGEEAKWYWMAKIAGLPFDKDIEVLRQEIAKLGKHGLHELTPAEIKALNAKLSVIDAELTSDYRIYLPKKDFLLTKLMFYGAFGENPPEKFDLVFKSANSLVLIYELVG